MFKDPSETVSSALGISEIIMITISYLFSLFKTLLQVNCCHRLDSHSIFAVQVLLQFSFCAFCGVEVIHWPIKGSTKTELRRPG